MMSQFAIVHCGAALAARLTSDRKEYCISQFSHDLNDPIFFFSVATALTVRI